MENADNRQLVIIENRKKLTIDNVINVDSFNDDYLELTSRAGVVGVEGRNLKIEELIHDTGKINITGEITGFFYKEAKSLKGFFRKRDK